MPDIVIAGIQLPFFVVLLVVAGALHLAVDQIFAQLNVYARIWHPGLFRIAVFLSLISSIALIIYW